MLMTDEAEPFIDINGEQRLLGTLPLAGAVVRCTLPTYEAQGPMFEKADLIRFAGEMDTRGRSRFDSSYIADQKNHGSCNGFAAAAALGRARVRRGLKRVDLSGAYIYSLMNGGRDNGSVLVDGMDNVQTTGIATAATVPWNKIYPNQYDKAKADAEAKRFKAHECYVLTTEIAFFSALAAGFDVVLAVHAGNNFMRLNSDGISGSDRGPGNHATAADGYTVINGELCADMVNSWGLSFGTQGRCWISWSRHLVGTVQYHGFYAMRGAIDDPEDTNPVALK
jgi:hypothetical protein